MATPKNFFEQKIYISSNFYIPEFRFISQLSKDICTRHTSLVVNCVMLRFQPIFTTKRSFQHRRTLLQKTVGLNLRSTKLDFLK